MIHKGDTSLLLTKKIQEKCKKALAKKFPETKKYSLVCSSILHYKEGSICVFIFEGGSFRSFDSPGSIKDSAYVYYSLKGDVILPGRRRGVSP